MESLRRRCFAAVVGANQDGYARIKIENRVPQPTEILETDGLKMHVARTFLKTLTAITNFDSQN